MNTLYIAEKPSLATAIAKYLGGFTKSKTAFEKGDTKVTWCYGHVFATVEPEEYDPKYHRWTVSDLPIIPSNWILKPRADAKEQVKAIKEMLQWADVVIHAGDPDREGQLLVDEVLEYYDYKGTVKRILINATDDTSLKRAFDSILENSQFKNLSEAGLGRSKMDWLLGMSGTRLYTLRYQHLGGKGKLNVGRVQTPTLALVVNREHEIINFKEQKFFDIHATISVDNEQFKGKLVHEGYIVEQSEAEALMSACKAAGTATIKEWAVNDKKEAPPLPYSLDSLQGYMNKKVGWSPKKTLDITQKLYEMKYVSYPRSDCNYLPMGQYSDAHDILDAISRGSTLPSDFSSHANTSLQSKCFNDKKITAHHAIIPTREAPSGLDADQQLLYDEIALRYILQWYPAMEFTETKYVFSVASEDFSGRSVFIRDKGFKALIGSNKEDEDTNDVSVAQKAVTATTGDSVPVSDVDYKEGVTKPPKRFTEGTLLTAMANIHRFVSDPEFKEKLKEIKGIGTPATRSTIIAGLIDNGFLSLDGKSLRPTALGEELVKNIPSIITAPDMTAKMELSLMDVEKGTTSLNAVMSEYESFLKGLVEAETTIFAQPPKIEGVECPVCHEGVLILKKGSKGPFWGCSAYAQNGCKAIFSDANGKPAIYESPDCHKGFLKQRKGSKGTFWGCSNYPDCKCTKEDAKGKPKL